MLVACWPGWLAWTQATLVVGWAMDDWNDARFVLAVARAGGLVAAAKALRVDHSTVFRRLSGLESRLGPLFERQPGGVYRPTPAGARAALAVSTWRPRCLALRATSPG